MMDFESVAKQVTPKVADQDVITAKVLGAHDPTGPRYRKASDALALVKEGLAVLATLGHYYGLAEGLAAPKQAFPKMLYHDRYEPETVEGPEELQELLLNGWRETPLAVQPIVQPEPAAAAAEQLAVPAAEDEPETESHAE